jgi:hypothetical protein
MDYPQFARRFRSNGDGSCVAYVALSCGYTVAGPDIRDRRPDNWPSLEAARINSLASADPGLAVSISCRITLASQRRPVADGGSIAQMPNFVSSHARCRLQRSFVERAIVGKSIGWIAELGRRANEADSEALPHEVLILDTH